MGGTDDHLTKVLFTDASHVTFDLSLNGAVNTIVRQADGKIAIAGVFTSANALGRSRIARFNTDGTTDLQVNFGSGFNNSVSQMILDNNSHFVAVGDFTTFDGDSSSYLARILGGNIGGGIPTNGRLEFSSVSYTQAEPTDAQGASVNATITVKRTAGLAGTVTVDFGTVEKTFGQANVDSATDRITTTSNHGLSVNDVIRFATDGTLPTPLITTENYHVGRSSVPLSSRYLRPPGGLCWI